MNDLEHPKTISICSFQRKYDMHFDQASALDLQEPWNPSLSQWRASAADKGSAPHLTNPNHVPGQSRLSASLSSLTEKCRPVFAIRFGVFLDIFGNCGVQFWHRRFNVVPNSLGKVKNLDLHPEQCNRTPLQMIRSDHDMLMVRMIYGRLW